MEKDTVLEKVEEILKDIHPDNYPIKEITIEAINLFFAEPVKEEYKITDRKLVKYFDTHMLSKLFNYFLAIFREIGVIKLKSMGLKPENRGTGRCYIAIEMVRA